jgi:putative flippase GtrA
MNKNITFNSSSRSLYQPIKFIFLYSISFFFNSTTHDFFLSYDINYFPFIAATIISIIINFTGQKYWVFKETKD